MALALHRPEIGAVKSGKVPLELSLIKEHSPALRTYIDLDVLHPAPLQELLVTRAAANTHAFIMPAEGSIRKRSTMRRVPVLGLSGALCFSR